MERERDPTRALWDGLHSREDYAHRLFRERFGAYAASPKHSSRRKKSRPKRSSRCRPRCSASSTCDFEDDTKYSLESFRGVYERAYGLGLKGCAAFRSNPVTGAVLLPEDDFSQ